RILPLDAANEAKVRVLNIEALITHHQLQGKFHLLLALLLAVEAMELQLQHRHAGKHRGDQQKGDENHHQVQKGRDVEFYRFFHEALASKCHGATRSLSIRLAHFTAAISKVSVSLLVLVASQE